MDARSTATIRCVTRQPGGTATGDRIRELLLDSRSAGIAPMAEMALMFADRAQAIAEVIEPALAAGHIVLCDRLTDSTEAYQGGGRKLGSAGRPRASPPHLRQPSARPDLLLLPPLEASLKRARRRNDRTTDQRPRRKPLRAGAGRLLPPVWRKYRKIATRDSNRVICIEGDLTIDQVHQQIVDAVSMRLTK